MKQHYVPQSYLREFLNNEGKLHTIDISLLKYRRKVFDEPKDTAQVCRSIDFYTIDPKFSSSFKHLADLDPLYLEKKFHIYEQQYPIIIQKIKNKQRALIRKDGELLLYALVDIKIRNPYFRHNIIDSKKEKIIDENLNEFIKDIDTVDFSEFPLLSKTSILKAIDDVKTNIMSDKSYAQKAHISSLVLRKKDSSYGIHEKIIDHLLQFEWLIFESKNNFITTDNPGISLDQNNIVQNTKFDANFYFFMPLTASICLGITPKKRDLKFTKNAYQKLLTYVKAPHELVELINEMHGYHLNRHIFSNNKVTIDKIAVLVNNNAGLL